LACPGWCLNAWPNIICCESALKVVVHQSIDSTT
jgi:hypothetical protein